MVRLCWPNNSQHPVNPESNIQWNLMDTLRPRRPCVLPKTSSAFSLEEMSELHAPTENILIFCRKIMT